MSITTDRAIEILRTKVQEIKNLNSVDEYNIWKNATSLTLGKVLPTEANLHKKFEQNGAAYHGMGDFSNLVKAKDQAKALLEGAIENIEHFGIEEATAPQAKGGDININVHQSVEQQVTQQVEIKLQFIIEAFKHELTEEQIGVLKEIHESNDPPATKKRRFFQKLGSFGTDVTAGVLSGILSNPEIMGGLFK